MSIFEFDRQSLIERIQNVSRDDFTELAFDIFKFQLAHNPIYRDFVNLIGVNAKSISDLSQIPCLPISLFKTHAIQTGKWTPNKYYVSSGTTGMMRSKHLVRDPNLYVTVCFRAFTEFYGHPGGYCFVALLPGYLEHQHSSLVHMVKAFIESSDFSESGFYKESNGKLIPLLSKLKNKKVPTVFLGVSFALLAMPEVDLNTFIVMETGGMKGKRKEMTREELHAELSSKFNVNTIHSEYGMTELFSQAYSRGAGLFNCGPTMRIFCNDLQDPLSNVSKGSTGLINVIDLANIDTCAFVATQDIGRINMDGTFQILGRSDGSDIRGCSLLYQSEDAGFVKPS